MPSFWQWYAQANDDIRHELIERGWYGRQTTADAAWQPENDLQPEPESPQHEGTVWAQENAQGGQGEAMADFYGTPGNDQGAPEIETPKIEPPQHEPEP